MKKILFSLISFLTLSSTVVANDAKPWTFWYWMNGAVTQEGITADLEAMSEIGLGGCYLMPIYGIERRPELGGTIRQGTPEFWQMVDYSLKEADRVGLKIGLHICDGFALAGGPWITPGQSMQKVVSTDTILSIKGKKPLVWSDELLPAAPTGYYADIATYAIPLKYQPIDTELKPQITSEGGDFAVDGKGRLKAKQPCTFYYTYEEPITVSALEITTYNNSLQALRMKVTALDDSGDPLHGYEKGVQLIPPRHGWQNYDCPTTIALPTVRTRKLKFEWTPVGTEKGSEDLDNGKWGPTLKIQEMKVLATPRIDDWEGKAGLVWRVSSEKQDFTSADMYVPINEVIRLTSGTALPNGDWRIVRIGHTSTLHENATGGDCKGLECDKFSRSATQSQLDHWFGEAFKQCDSTVAHRVLKYMHIDSWECACQNWSDSITSLRPNENNNLNPNHNDNPNKITFAQYFEQQRGYDLMPYLPLMVGIPMENQKSSERVLRDVRTTIAQLIDESFYPTLVAEARKQDCRLSAESVAPTMISDGMAHYKHADYPMGEFWLNSPTHDKPNDMLDAISGGHVYGKQIIQAEGFTELRGIFNEAPAQLKPLLDKQYCLGINRLFFHVYAHNPDPSKKPGMTLDGIGLFFQRTQPWWKEGKSFVDYITRCQRLLQWGRPVVDVAVYTGNEMPRRSILPERLAPIPGYHYDSFNFDAITSLRSYDNENDNLNVETKGQKSDFRPTYKVIAFPGARKMDPDLQPMPEAGVLALAELEKEGIKTLTGAPTASALKLMGIEPDAILPEEILFAHRQGAEGDVYFLSNQKDEPIRFDASFRIESNNATLYDAVSNTYTRLPIFEEEKAKRGYTSCSIELPAHGSCFVMLGQIAAREGHISPIPGVVESTSAIVPTTPYQLTFEEHGITLTSDTLVDWSKVDNDSIRYYSGRVRYTFDFKYKPNKKQTGRIVLRLKDLHDVASVILNGKDCGAVWTAPYELDVTNALLKGKNHIEVTVANSWNNAIVGHDAGHDPFANIWTNAKYRAPKPELLPAGLGALELVNLQ